MLWVAVVLPCLLVAGIVVGWYRLMTVESRTRRMLATDFDISLSRHKAAESTRRTLLQKQIDNLNEVKQTLEKQNSHLHEALRVATVERDGLREQLHKLCTAPHEAPVAGCESGRFDDPDKSPKEKVEQPLSLAAILESRKASSN